MKLNLLNVEKNYISMIKNSVGTNMFRNLYMHTEENMEDFDAAEDGDKSCALFVTGILKMFNRIDNMHATSIGTHRYLESSPDWVQVQNPEVGDVIFWDRLVDTTGHVGFYIGENQAISNDSEARQPKEHNLTLKDGRTPVGFWHYIG